MTGNRRANDNLELRQSIIDLSNLGTDHADISLMDATVTIGMNNIIGGLTLPVAADAAFHDVRAAAPHMVESINLELDYDRIEQHFSIVTGSAAFDNQRGLAFASRYQFEPFGELHAMDLVSPLPSGKAKLDRIGLVAPDELQDFFASCGVEVPMTPVKAEWSALSGISQAAENRTTTAISTTLHSVSEELVITDSVVSSDPHMFEPDDHNASGSKAWRRDAAEQHMSSRAIDARQAWVREVSLQIIDFAADVPTSLEAVLRSDDPLQQPKFAALYSHNLLELAKGSYAKFDTVLIAPSLERITRISKALRTSAF